jgi:hypothetical protein
LAALLIGLTLVVHPAPSAAQVTDGNWAMVSAGGAPSPRRNYASMYDAAHQRYIVFGGEWGTLYGGYQLFNEVWTLTLGATPAWGQLTVAGSPPGERHSPQFGYDAARNRLLVFGGYGRHYPGDPYAYLNDVWQLSLDDPPTWTELLPTGTPPPGRLAGAAVYDDFRQRFVGFGGTVGLPVDTWELDLSGDPAWNTVNTDSAGPPGSYGMASIFDARRDRMIIFGGSTSDDYYGVHNDTWALNLRDQQPEWHKLDPAGPLPAARRTMTSIYDPIRDRMVVYGGWDSVGESNADFLGDAWSLELDNVAWTKLAPAGVPPTGRDAISAIYDPVNDQLAVFGGWTGTDMLNDAWTLRWGGTGQAAAMVASSSASPTNAHVEWSITDNTSTYAAVYRRAGTGPWTSLSVAQTDATGHLAYNDATVTAGASYGYMVVIPSEKGSQFGGKTSITIPTVTGVDGRGGLSLALDRVQPNPVRAQFAVSFTLPGDSPATLELFDVNGRRVLERQVGMGAGRHTVSLGTAREFGSGMYFLRLTSTGETLNQRVVIGH